jgi:hypothetical protein
MTLIVLAMRCDVTRCDIMRLHLRFWAGEADSRTLSLRVSAVGFLCVVSLAVSLSQRNYRILEHEWSLNFAREREGEPGGSVFSPYLIAYDMGCCCRLDGSLAVPCRLSTVDGMVEGWITNDGRVTDGRKMNGEQCGTVSHAKVPQDSGSEAPTTVDGWGLGMESVKNSK